MVYEDNVPVKSMTFGVRKFRSREDRENGSNAAI